MVKVRDKIKISNINTTVVKIHSDNTAEVVYIDKGNGHRVLNSIVFTDGLWKFENDNDYGRKLKDSEYSDFTL